MHKVEPRARGQNKSKKRRCGNSKRKLGRETKGAEGIYGYLLPFCSEQQLKCTEMAFTSPGKTNNFVGNFVSVQ